MNPECIPTSGNVRQIREIWETLEKSGNTSYFLSWGWIENWITSLPEHAKPELIVFMEGKDPLLAFFLGKADLVRKHVFRSRGLFVNATGMPAFDCIYIEYNGFLCKQAETFRFIDVLRSLPHFWDELYLPVLDARSFPGKAALDNVPPYKTIVDDDLLSPFVNLDMVRKGGGDYLSLLSANTRAQIHRSYRLYGHAESLRCEVARDPRSAIDIYRELIGLHQDTWTNRNKEGAFFSDYMLQFHEQLIRSRFEYDEIQLLRVKCGDNTIGCLYNFVYKNNVYFYQSGLNYTLDKQLKPGLVTHVEAIKYNTMAGHETYDFLGGNSRYKTSLATHHNRLVSVRLQKPLLKFKIENVLKTFKHLLVEHRKRITNPHRDGNSSRLG